MIGRWRVTFNTDGTYELGRQDVGRVASGQFTSDGDQVTLRDETGVLACAPGDDDEGAVTYRWEMTEGGLLLTTIEDPCARRRLC